MVPFILHITSEACSNVHLNYKHYPMIFDSRTEERNVAYVSHFYLLRWTLQNWFFLMGSVRYILVLPKNQFLFISFLQNLYVFFKFVEQFIFKIWKTRDSSSEVPRILHHSRQINWLKLKNWVQESDSCRPLFCIKIARTWRHSDVICCQPILGTIFCT